MASKVSPNLSSMATKRLDGSLSLIYFISNRKPASGELKEKYPISFHMKDILVHQSISLSSPSKLHRKIIPSSSSLQRKEVAICRRTHCTNQEGGIGFWHLVSEKEIHS
jgi:hypothetical protein